MAWEHQKSGTTFFFDIVRYILILSGTCYILSLIGEHSSVFGLLAALPVYVIMLNVFGFLTLPLYSFTPENRAKSKMLNAMQKGDFESAKTQTDTFVREFKVNVPKESETDHDIAEAHNNRGIAYLKLGRFQEAIEVYKQAIRIKPYDAHAHHMLGIIYLINRDKGSALKEYKILKTLDAEKANELFNKIHK